MFIEGVQTPNHRSVISLSKEISNGGGKDRSFYKTGNISINQKKRQRKSGRYSLK
jgi:hypothetical protein